MDGTDARISGGVVTNDMCSSWRKQADPATGRGYGGWGGPLCVYTEHLNGVTNILYVNTPW